MNAQSAPSALRAQMEDHALTSVPAAERKSGWGLMTSTAGIASTLQTRHATGCCRPRRTNR